MYGGMSSSFQQRASLSWQTAERATGVASPELHHSPATVCVRVCVCVCVCVCECEGAGEQVSE